MTVSSLDLMRYERYSGSIAFCRTYWQCPAVDEQDCPCDIRSRVGSQEDHWAEQLVEARATAKRRADLDSPFGFRIRVFVCRALHDVFKVTGRDGVHADT